MRHNRFILPLLIAALAACTPIEPAATDSMVVEGWIESGAPPVVMLSYTITPTSEKKTFDSLADVSVTGRLPTFKVPNRSSMLS